MPDAGCPILFLKNIQFIFDKMYLANNGVETWRQKVPPNAVEITSLLLVADADVHAKADVYGDRFDTMALLMSSAHPAEAGLTDRIAAVLKEAVFCLYCFSESFCIF